MALAASSPERALIVHPRFALTVSRRSLLASTAAVFVASTTEGHARVLTGGMPWEPGVASPPKPVRPGPWMFFTSDEGLLVEAVVDRLIPPDDRGPGGKNAGCAVFIDRQLAGPYGCAAGLYLQPPFAVGVATQGYQMPEAPATRYRVGLRALADFVKTTFSGKSLPELAAADQDKVLAGLEKGSIELKDVSGVEFFALLLQNTMEGFFADPIYGGNRDMVGWKLIGFPGARYDYRDWVERHNEAYPLPPVSITGRPDWTVKE
jgi:gluconate 2-dehydrogenase gamma chain